MKEVREGPADRESLRRSEERYRLLAEAVQDYAIFMLDPEGHISSWNTGAQRIKGYSAEEILGQHFSRFYPEDAIRRGWPQQELEIAKVQGRIEDEGWRLRKDGSRFWANVVITALRDEQGQLVGFAKVTRDLTERRAAEEQARQLAAERAARAEAEASDRRKNEYLAMLAHELRNPLASMLPTLHILRQAGADPEVRRESIDRLDRQARNLRRMVDDLMEASRVTHRKLELRTVRLDLARLVRSSAEERRDPIEKAGLTLTLDTSPTPVWVMGDPIRLDQIIQNLLDNAVKFCESGSHVEVSVRTDEAAKQAILAIRDDGVGIEPEVLVRLFQPFVQGRQGPERRHGGLGLGLSVVKGLAQLHGGTAEAHSAGAGRGATFTVRLPLEREPEALASQPDLAESGAVGRRILVVEDNRDAAESLSEFLRLRGHEVRLAHTGPDGVQAAAEWLPEVVLADIGLPGFDGHEVARRVRRLAGMEEALLVALTAGGADEDRHRGAEAGFDHFFTKPADPAALQRVLAGHRA